MTRSSSAMLVLLACFALGCPRSDVVATWRDGGSFDAGGRDASFDAPPTDTAFDAPRPDGGFCDGTGPLFQVGDGIGEPRCGGTVTQTTFRYALCACDGFALAHELFVDAFDSRDGPYAPGGRGGSVGSNVDLAGSANVFIKGSLTAELDVEGSGERLEVEGTIRAGGMCTGNARFRAGKDLYAGRGVSVDRLHVGGLVHVPDGAAYDVRTFEEVGGVVREPVDVDTPCDCEPSRLLDIDAVVASYRDDNDDAMAGLSPGQLGEGDGRSVTLDCGRYYFDRIAGGSLELVIRGRVAIFVASDFSLTGPFVVRFEPGGELDLFVDGNVVAMDTWTVGDPDRPSRLRLYVGGAGTFDLGAGGAIAAHVYAPRAELVTPGALELYGSLFARRMAVSGPLTVHYDEAILDAGDSCPMPGTCSSCRDCGNQACVDGACGLCRSDADCCAPLVCAAGRCIPEPF
ncbi:MAG: hypothetical protein H6721_25980 [Sandaracinus sp.]|nr:hypothetical protein [Sandaracinus sp.]MCB9635583.1 hypothetical protein [Sandaracinus sp.]